MQCCLFKFYFYCWRYYMCPPFSPLTSSSLPPAAHPLHPPPPPQAFKIKHSYAHGSSANTAHPTAFIHILVPNFQCIGRCCRYTDNSSKYKFYDKMHTLSWCTCAFLIVYLTLNKHPENKGITYYSSVEAGKCVLSRRLLGLQHPISWLWWCYMGVCLLLTLNIVCMLYMLALACSLTLLCTYTHILRRRKKTENWKVKKKKNTLKAAVYLCILSNHIVKKLRQH